MVSVIQCGLMKRVRTYGREVLLLALAVGVVAVLSGRNDDIVPEVAVDPLLSCGAADEECRLKMSYVVDRLAPIKQMRYSEDISWLDLESPLSLVYRVSEDRQAYLLTCPASHHEREGAVLRPVSTEKGFGLVKGAVKVKAPLSVDETLSLRDFLGIPRFQGSHAVVKMGRFNVLVEVFDPGEEGEFMMTLPLNPDNDLKSLHDRSLGDYLAFARHLSEGARAEIIRKYRVEDPFVLERLDPTWDKLGAMRDASRSESVDGDR